MLDFFLLTNSEAMAASPIIQRGGQIILVDMMVRRHLSAGVEGALNYNGAGACESVHEAIFRAMRVLQ